MSTDYVVRLAGPEHVNQLPDIEREAATRFGDSLPESVRSHVTPSDVLAAAQQEGLLWVALEPAGDPVGFALASIFGRSVHLEELDVLPAHGRKGVGSALIEAVEESALNSGCVEITLTTFRDVPWNAPFYVRVGFEVIPEHELGTELVRRLSDEAALGLERSRRLPCASRCAAQLAHQPDATSRRLFLLRTERRLNATALEGGPVEFRAQEYRRFGPCSKSRQRIEAHGDRPPD